MIKQHGVNNDLLAALDTEAYAALMGRAIEQPLPGGIDLARAGERIDFCWFPTSGLVSVIALDADGGEAEAGMIGREGVVNVPVLLGDDCSAMRILVQVAGTAIRVEVAAVRMAMRDRPLLAAKFLAYAQVFTVQIGASALAYARYPIQQRLARWLLMCGDRVGDGNITLTHEALSIMLGVRRPGVTVALQALEATTAIRSGRAQIEITDRAHLIDLSGAGYGLPEREYQRLLGRQPLLN